MSNDKQAGTAPLDALIKECRLEQKVEKHSAAMRGMTLEQAEQYVGAELVLAPSQSVPLQVPRWQDRTHEMDGPHKRLELACQEIEQLRTALAHALPPDQGLSQPGRWNVLSDDDKPDASRLLDVILSNGVCLMDRQHSKIDWSAVRDWRYSAAPAQADEARDAARRVERRIQNIWEDANADWGDAVGGPPAHEIFAHRLISAMQDEIAASLAGKGEK